MAVRDGDGKSGRHRMPLTRSESKLLRRDNIHARSAICGVGGSRQPLAMRQALQPDLDVRQRVRGHRRFSPLIYGRRHPWRSEEHTSELQSLMRTSYAVFCLKKKNRLKKKIYLKQKRSNDQWRIYIIYKVNTQK